MGLRLRKLKWLLVDHGWKAGVFMAAVALLFWLARAIGFAMEIYR